MALFSKDGGNTFKVIQDTNVELISAAKQKGYTQYQDMSKDGGETIKTVKADLVKPALDKGYQFLDVIQSTNANLGKVTKEAQSSEGKFESMLRGFAQNATLGFADDIVGAAAAINPLSNQTFAEARDAYRQGNDLAWEANPIQYGAGAAPAIVSQIAAAPVVGGLRGLGAGAAIGGLGALGSSEREGLDLAVDTALGTGLGGLFGGVGGKQAAQATTKAIGNAAAMPAQKLVSRVSGELDDIAEKAAVREIGGEALSRRVTEARRIGIDELGKQREDIIKQLELISNPKTFYRDGDSGKFERLLGQLAQIDDQISVHDLGGDLMMKLQPNQFSPRILDKTRELTLQNIDDVRLNNLADDNPLRRDIVRNIVDNTSKSTSPNANRSVSTGLVATGAGASIGAGLAGGAGAGLGAGLAGVALATPAGRAVLGKVPIIGKPVRGLDNLVERPNYALAIGAADLSEILRKSPQRLGKFANTLAKAADERGPAGLRATHYILMQNNPEYRAMFTGESESTE